MLVSRRDGNNVYYRVENGCVAPLLDLALCLMEDEARPLPNGKDVSRITESFGVVEAVGYSAEESSAFLRGGESGPLVRGAALTETAVVQMPGILFLSTRPS